MLLLLPNLLGEQRHHEPFLPASVSKAMQTIDGLIAESESGARRYLGRFQLKKPAHEIPVALLNEHTKEEDLDFLLEPLKKGERWGLISDAGLPCIADPGHQLVERARQLGIAIQAFVGPSALLLALMLSGLPGQQFTFHGYLDKNPQEREKQIVQIQRECRSNGYTQIFMETPYRNEQALDSLLKSLDPSMQLCVAWDLTLPTQSVVCLPIEAWKKSQLPNLNKKNAIFLLNFLRTFH